MSYSGGRDSHFLYWFIKEYLKDEKIEIVGINTGIEITDIATRIKDNSDRVLRPSMKLFDIKENFGIPCVSKRQDELVYDYRRQVERGKVTEYYKNRVENAPNYFSYFKINKKVHKALFDGSLHKISHHCCTYLKKKPARDYEKTSGKMPIFGYTPGESLSRNRFNSCFNKVGHFHPLFDLYHDLQVEIENEFGIEVPSVYQQLTQTGCIGCPYGGVAKNNELFFATPQQYKFITEYFKESYEFNNFEYKKFEKTQ